MTYFGFVDDAVDAGSDAVGDAGNTLSNIALAPFNLAGDAAGGLFGGFLGGLGNWLFQIAALAIGAWVVVQVI